MPLIEPEDLEPFGIPNDEKSEAMIADALAMAELVAPCITDDDFAYAAVVKAVLRSAILRWHEAGQGAVTQLTALGFGQAFDTRQNRRGMFLPSEIEQLQGLCKTAATGRAFEVDLVPPGAGVGYGIPLWDSP